MKEYRIIDFSLPYDNFRIKEKYFCELVNELKLNDDFINRYTFSICIEMQSDIYQNIDSIAERYNLKAIERGYRMQYTSKELSQAPFLEITLCIYGKADYTQSYQTEFCDFYCTNCDSHQLIPKGEIYINKVEFRGKDIATSMKHNNEIIVSDKMKKLIEDANLTGVKFYPAYHYNNKLKNDYPAWHMVITSIMPPIDESMPLFKLEGYCDVCRKHHKLPLSFVRYKNDEIKKASDFNISCEMFGNGWYGSPKLIISHKVYDLIKNNKIKGCKFEIVGIVNSCK